MNHIGKFVAAITIFMLAIFLFILNLVGFTSGGFFENILFGILLLALGLVGFQYDKIRTLHRENQHVNNVLKGKSENITEITRQLEENKNALEKKETEISQFFDSIDVTAFSFDVQSMVLDIAKGIEEIYGYTNQEFRDNYLLWYEVIHPDDKQKADKIRQKLRQGEAVIFDHRIISKNEEIRWVSIRFSIIYDAFQKLTRIIGVVIDITDRKILEEKLRQLAYHDELTDLPNRTLLMKHLRKAIARSKRHNHILTVMFIDLDGFKKINDTMGHEAGDILLKDVATRLKEIVREEDMLSRLGGDEFLIVFEDTGREELEVIAEQIIQYLSEPFQVNEESVKITPSIGISMYPENGVDIDTLILNADKAMYAVKYQGKSNYKFYSPEHETIKPPTTVLEKVRNLFSKS